MGGARFWTRSGGLGRLSTSIHGLKPEDADHKVQRGDIWMLNGHRLMCGDSTIATDVQQLLAGQMPHIMVTDVPYGREFDAGWRARVLGRPHQPRSVMNDDRANWRDAFALFKGDVAYVYHSNIEPEVVIAGLESVGLMRKDNIICVKPQFVIGRGNYQQQYKSCWYAIRRGRNSYWNGQRNQSNVWMMTSNQGERDARTNHGTQKPVECMLRPIENSSQDGDAVYDPFVGSGTTIIAAEISGRRCYAMNLDPIYCGVAIARWQRFTQSDAILEATGQTFVEVMSERLRGEGAAKPSMVAA